MTVFPGKGYNEIAIGDSFGAAVTVTETHLVLAAGLIGDSHPLHINEEFAKQTRFGGRVLHGVFTGALVGGPVGTYFAGTGIAYLEHNCRFTAPVRPGDTLTTRWTIAEKHDKPKHGGGLVVLKGECRNQQDEIVVEADAKIIVRSV
ncbi:MAG: acyl dehydratase [Betaproteobacteria bacterium]|nr:acyl dehydratase [Betaproteobacteria bacterium]